MSLYKKFRTDTNLERDGIELEYGINDRGEPIRIKIARAGGSNERFLKLLEKRTQPIRRAIQTETADLKQVDRIMMEVYADTVVIGWSGVDIDETENGPAIPSAPFSRANLLRLFADLPDIWRDIQEQAGRAALFRAEIREADAKN